MKKWTPQRILSCLVIVAITLSLSPIQAMANTGITTARLFGSDRIGTAVNVADTGWTTAQTAILAPAADANLVDALAAAPLAGKDMPILLTDIDNLSDETRAELTKLHITNVYVVGAITQTVVDQVNGMGLTATPLKGADRIGTATAIASKLSNPTGTFVVGYSALADALSVASFAAANNFSILVTNPDGSLPESEKAYLSPNLYIIGGPTLVKDISGARRLSGLDRFATNEAVLNAFADFSYDKVYVANGNDNHLVDSLVASSLAAQTKSPIVLTDNVTVNAVNKLHAKLAPNAVVTALGGNTVVTDTVVNQIVSGFVTPPATFYPAGMYKIGVDMPAGEYVLVTNDYGYFEVSSDSSGSFESIIVNDFFGKRSIINVSDGQYFKFEYCTAYPYANAPAAQPVNGYLADGMYKVGVDLPAGEYQIAPVLPEAGDMGYYILSSDSSHSYDEIIAIDTFTESRYLTVENGQYLTLLNAKVQLK